MKTETRKAFEAWYAKQEGKTFNFREEMLQYCRSDVDILRRGYEQFRTEFQEMTTVDPLQHVTIASACMAAYRAQHIPNNQIGMIPKGGYVTHDNHSRASIEWLDWVAHTQGIQIQHALNGVGEYRIGNRRVDGYSEDSATGIRTVYEYQGCLFHACKDCFNPETIHPLTGLSMKATYEATIKRENDLKALGYNVVTMWEHQFNHLKKTDAGLQAFLHSHRVVDRLNPRDSLFGGRTNACKLVAQGHIRYIDFTSLYPYINKTSVYPIGHPEVITSDFKDVSNYLGLISATVLPCRQLYHPVLPYRANGKLHFTLCRTCSEGELPQPCHHEDDERALTGTWVSEELKKALEKGYKIVKIHEVYHFREQSTDLFASYINCFLKVKQESSGWPEDCLNDEMKDRYLHAYFEHEGIRLDRDSVAVNPGRRATAKVSLNSLWGRFGMRLDNRSSTEYFDTPAQLGAKLMDETIEIIDVHFIDEVVGVLEYRSRKEFCCDAPDTNIFLAAFTTAYARLKLYSVLEQVDRRAIYYDTDSLIFHAEPGNDPPLGNYLGDFTDETPNDYIIDFVSGGPKQYGYGTAKGKVCWKIRGFTKNSTNDQILNKATLEDLVKTIGDNRKVTVTNPRKITRLKAESRLVNRVEHKDYRPVYTKRWILPDMDTIPYGF